MWIELRAQRKGEGQREGERGGEREREERIERGNGSVHAFREIHRDFPDASSNAVSPRIPPRPPLLLFSHGHARNGSRVYYSWRWCKVAWRRCRLLWWKSARLRTRRGEGKGEGFWGIESVEGSKNLKGVKIRELLVLADARKRIEISNNRKEWSTPVERSVIIVILTVFWQSQSVRFTLLFRTSALFLWLHVEGYFSLVTWRAWFAFTRCYPCRNFSVSKKLL